MKSLIIIMFGIVVNICQSQIINIPDTNFKTKLTIANQTNYKYAKNATGNWIRIDTNFDGEIQVSEALEVHYLDLYLVGTNIDYWPVQSIEGIQYFTNLETLTCRSNPIYVVPNLQSLTNLKNLSFYLCGTLTSLNLTGLSLLESLSVAGNVLTQIDLSDLNSLKSFSCMFNQITSLNFDGLINLNDVACSNNQINTLDFSSNPLMKQLYCNNNNLSSLNIKNGINQDFTLPYYNDCWKTGNPNLTTICVDDSELASVQNYLNSCDTTTPTPVITSANCGLANDQFAVNEVVVYPNPSSNGIYSISFNSKVNDCKIDVYSLLGQKIFENNYKETDQIKIDLSDVVSGTYLFKVSYDSNFENKLIIKN